MSEDLKDPKFESMIAKIKETVTHPSEFLPEDLEALAKSLGYESPLDDYSVEHCETDMRRYLGEVYAAKELEKELLAEKEAKIQKLKDEIALLVLELAELEPEPEETQDELTDAD